MTQSLTGSVGAAGLSPLRVETSSGDAAGPADAAVMVRVDRHEFVRAYLGRRSRDQIRLWHWTGDAERYIPHLAVFGPRETPLVD